MSNEKQVELRDSVATRYRLEIRTLSPVHIGSGEGTLHAQVPDYLQDGRQIAVLDPARLGEGLSDEQIDRLVVGFPLREILRDLPRGVLNRMTRYQLQSPFGDVSKFEPAIKLPDGRPYIPGSSLKGAIRTVLAWAMLRAGEVTVRTEELDNRKEHAGDVLEHELFGDEPNRDLMRALHVNDSAGLAISQGLTLSRVRVYSIRSGDLQPKRFTIYLETIPPGVSLTAQARRDDGLLKQENAAKLGFAQRTGYLENLVQHCNAFSRALVEAELKFYSPYGLASVLHFYEQLRSALDEINGKHECILRIARGTGWQSKTVGMVLDQEEIQDIRERYLLGRAVHRKCGRVVQPSRDGRTWYCRECRQPGIGHAEVKYSPVFPKSRHLADTGDGVLVPLGWVHLIFHPVSETVEVKPIEIEIETSGLRRTKLGDLRIHDQYEGTVVNIVDFGAFVDIGAEEDGLVHVSKMASVHVNDPHRYVRRGERVTVWILDVDLKRRRISLSLVHPSKL